MGGEERKGRHKRRDENEIKIGVEGGKERGGEKTTGEEGRGHISNHSTNNETTNGMTKC